MVEQHKQIHHLLSHPEKLGANDLSYLKDVINRYPYFQAARSLYLKGLKKESSPLYNAELQVTASHTADRSVLFDYITSAFFLQDNISNYIKSQQEILDDIKVDHEVIKILKATDTAPQEISQQRDDQAAATPVSVEEKPLNFNANEKHSFNEWLKLTSLKPIDRTNSEDHTNNEILDEERAKRMERIDLFLQERPRIRPNKERTTATNLAEFNPSPDQYMTETLAQVYLAQKNYNKAMQAYEILVLQHPEKSGFFADRIREIKNLQSNNT